MGLMEYEDDPVRNLTVQSWEFEWTFERYCDFLENRVKIDEIWHEKLTKIEN